MGISLALFCSLILSVIGTNAGAEFRVLYNPPSLKFSRTAKTLESVLKEIISASLGLSVDENTEWKGLYVLDPFSTPEAAVTVFVDGVSDLGNNTGLETKIFPLTVDEYDPNIYEAVKHRIKQRFTNGGNKLVNIKLSDQKQLKSRSVIEVFGHIIVTKVAKQPLVHLKYSVEEDYQFLYELQALKAITAKVSSGVISPDNIVDFYNFRYSSLHPLSDFHGPNSAEIEEAKLLLSNALQELSKAFVKAYRGSVFVTTIVTDVTHSRRVGRSPENDGEEPSENPAIPGGVDGKVIGSVRGSDEFDANFSVMFNIMFWFSLVYCFSLIAIVYTVMDMDPGRDTIIYRMTNVRSKKDV
ncbi:unnamed protein product [Arctia plantaginis]|uniref:Renin receptor n=1 Tax=Arctia plantaginis TaxID=874455 RepID=A0A8S1AYN2_ARCPL|nr:unnamed protein product [Arctia plantaginis]CAB3250681.1 unnamed protein product [Arctia plantaginis]